MTAPQDPFASPGGEPAGPPPQSEPPAWQGQQQPGYGAPAYGSPPPYGSPQFGMAPVPAGNRNGLGTASLVLGILSLVTWFLFIGGLFGIVAVVLGALGRGRAKRGEANNGGMALAGLITGAVGILLTVLVIVGVAALFSTGEFSNLTDCLQDADGDQGAVDDCRRQFEDSLE